jgi:hypothetical protein
MSATVSVEKRILFSLAFHIRLQPHPDGTLLDRI